LTVGCPVPRVPPDSSPWDGIAIEFAIERARA
jgi:hypothetical protein